MPTQVWKLFRPTKAQLRYELKIRGIDTKGLKKVVLQDRLKKALTERVVIQIEPQPIEQEQ